MAGDEKSSGGGGGGSKYSSHPAYPYILSNTDEKPEIYYNACAYAALYNRIKGNLMKIKPNADSTAFDVEINQIIRDRLGGSRAEAEAFLKELGYTGMFKMYDDGVINSDTRKAIKERDFDYVGSVDNFLRNMDIYMAKAIELSDACGKTDDMMGYDDIVKVLAMKRENSDKVFYMANRKLLGNDGYGGKAAGPITKAVMKAERRIENMKKTRRLHVLKTFGYAALTVGAGLLTGGLGFTALGLGGQILGGMFGVLYTGGAGGLLGAAVGTVAAGSLTTWSFGRAWGHAREYVRKRKEYNDYMRSTGKKYQDIDSDDFEHMGYRELKRRQKEELAIADFYKNYADGKVQTKKKKDSYDAIDYVQPKYRKFFLRYVENQVEVLGEKGRSAKTLFTNAKRHRFVYTDASAMKPNEVGFRKLETIIDKGSIRKYHKSDLTADEVYLNYADVSDPKSRLHPDMIAAHKGYDNSLQYLLGNLKEAAAYEDKFTDAHMQNEYGKVMKVFADNFNPAFASTVFGEAFTTNTVSNARDILGNENVKKMFETTGTSYNQAYIEGMLKYLEMESSRPINFGSDYTGGRFTSIDSSVGVSALNQIMLTEESIRNGCKTLYPEVGDAADAIIADILDPSKSRTDLEGIRATIDTTFGTANPKVARYLKLMLDKKKSAKTFSEDEIKAKAPTTGLTLTAAQVNDYNSIVTKIKNLTLKSDIDKLYKDISKLDDTAFGAVKGKLETALEDQIHALHLAENNLVNEKAMNAVQKGSNKEFTDYLQQIKELSKITEDETYDKIQTLLENINYLDLNQDLKNYLLLKLKQRVTELFLKESGLDKYKTTGEGSESLNHIRKYLRLANAYQTTGIIDKAQLYDIINMMNPNIKVVVENDLFYAKLDYFSDEAKIKSLKNLTTSGFSGSGLQEYFAMGTTETNELKEKVERVTQAAKFKEATTFNYAGSRIKPVEEEGKAISLVYFGKKRDGSDPLNAVLAGITALRDKASTSDFARYLSTTPPDTALKTGYFGQLQTLYSNIMSITDVNDRYAALMILKNEILTHFMHFSVAYLGKYGAKPGMYQNAILAGGVAATYPADAAKYWTDTTNPDFGGLISKIDSDLSTLSTSVTYERCAEYKHIGRAKAFVDKCTSTTIDQALTTGERTLSA